jgi:hypothetical protein
VDDGDDDDNNDDDSGDQHALMLIQLEPSLCTSSRVKLVAATHNFCQSNELNS